MRNRPPDDRAPSPGRSRRHRRACPRLRRCGRAAARPPGSAERRRARAREPAETVRRRRRSRPKSARCSGATGVDAAIATRKNTIAPHSIEPPYLTMKAGNPRPKPKSAQGEAADNDRQAQADAGGHWRSLAQSLNREAVGSSATGIVSSNAVPCVGIERGGWRRHGRPAWRARWRAPCRCRRCRGAS